MAVFFCLAFIALVGISVPFLAKKFGGENFLFTTVKEGTMKAIMCGDTFDHFVMAFTGHHLNDPKKSWYNRAEPAWEVLENGGAPDSAFDTRPAFLKSLGLYWVGLPWAYKVYEYQFEWNEPYTDPETKFEEVRVRKEWTDFIYVKDFTYAIQTNGPETKDPLQINLVTYVTVAVYNGYRALFATENWMRRITAPINQNARIYVVGYKYEELLAADQATRSAYSDPIIALNDKLPEDRPENPLLHGLQKRCGVVIRAANLQTIELSGSQKEKNEEKAALEYAATQEAEAKKISSEAQAAADIRIGQARADVIKMIGETEAAALDARLKIIKEHGEEGMALAYLDALKASGQGAGNTVVWPGNLGEILRSYGFGQGGGKA